MKTSPVLMMKAKKNDVEANGMMNAHLKDAVALCDFISQIAEEVIFKQIFSYSFPLKLVTCLIRILDTERYSLG